MQEKIWAYFIPINCHTHTDGNSTMSTGWYVNEEFDINNNIDWSMWDELVKTAAEKRFNTLLVSVCDGVKYESHPDISAPDAVSKAFLKQKLDEARALGLKVIPKLNFSCEHRCWLKEYGRMVSSKPYRKMCVDLIDEVCELFDNPEYFHLGMDEESSLDCQQWKEAVVMRGENLMFEDFGIMFDACRRNGARPWVWADYQWNNPEIYERRMPRDVVQSNWFYDMFRDYPETHFYHSAIAAYEKIAKMGFDMIPTASVRNDENTNPYQTFVHCQRVIPDKQILGYCDAPWYYLHPEEIYKHRNNLLQWGRCRERAEKEKILL